MIEGLKLVSVVYISGIILLKCLKSISQAVAPPGFFDWGSPYGTQTYLKVKLTCKCYPLKIFWTANPNAVLLNKEMNKNRHRINLKRLELEHNRGLQEQN